MVESAKKAVAALIISLMQPPATYFTIAIAGHLCASSPASFLAVVASLLPLLWFCSKQRHRLCGSSPAYASVAGHFGIVGAGLGLAFCMASLTFGFVFIRMIVSDPGRIDGSLLDECRGQIICHSTVDCPSTAVAGECQHSKLIIYDRYWRGKYCQYCHSFIERYDHHCAAVQNCIGSKNAGIFLLLLIISCMAELLYLVCCYLYMGKRITEIMKSSLNDDDAIFSENLIHRGWKVLCKEAWVLSIAVFVGLQILWQVPFLLFQLYLVGINLTTDEWVNWEKIPRFHRQETNPSEFCLKKFNNPYDKGFLANYKAMLHKWM
ncbi:hypothetical protein KP509_21G083000 [Ceratopteris richardii]|uniref:S-acyltransferase n=1 Tax=Ceratopteris richardii TaxID=49495 RepID=A0A8T2SFC1_CERRI|nr:hypothetical protein KP509_21G083000 [Ceratopteris richardii]